MINYVRVNFGKNVRNEQQPVAMNARCWNKTLQDTDVVMGSAKTLI